MVRFVHTADWQLGMTRYFLSDEAQARFADARLQAIRALSRVAQDHDAAFVVACGDVFESNHVDRRVVGRALAALGDCPVPVYLLPGNHDPLDAGSVYRSPTFTAGCPDNVVVLEGTVNAAPGVELVGAPWRSKRPLVDLVGQALSGLEPTTPGTVRVVAGHGAVDALSPARDDPALIRLDVVEDALATGRVHFVALGDRHSLTDVGASGRVWYAGAPEPTAHEEVLPGHVTVVELDGERVDVMPHEVGSWRFVRIDADLTSAVDLEALDAWLTGLPDKERTVAQLRLVGALSLRDKGRLDALLEAHRDVLAALELPAAHTDLAVVPNDADFADMGLVGFAEATLAELRAAATADASPVARDAVALLYRLTGERPRQEA